MQGRGVTINRRRIAPSRLYALTFVRNLLRKFVVYFRADSIPTVQRPQCKSFWCVRGVFYSNSYLTPTMIESRRLTRPLVNRSAQLQPILKPQYSSLRHGIYYNSSYNFVAPKNFEFPSQKFGNLVEIYPEIRNLVGKFPYFKIS